MPLDAKTFIFLFFSLLVINASCQQIIPVDTSILTKNAINIIGEVHNKKENADNLIELIKGRLVLNDTIELYLEMPKSDEILLNHYLKTGKVILYDGNKKQAEIYPCFNIVEKIKNELSSDELKKIKLIGISPEYEINKIYAAIVIGTTKINFKNSFLEDEILAIQQNFYDSNFETNKLYSLLEEISNRDSLIKYFSNNEFQIINEILVQFFAKSYLYNGKEYGKNESGYRDLVFYHNFKKAYSPRVSNTAIIQVGYDHLVKPTNSSGTEVDSTEQFNFASLLQNDYKKINTIGYFYRNEKKIMRRIFSSSFEKQIRKCTGKVQSNYFLISPDINNIHFIIK